MSSHLNDFDADGVQFFTSEDGERVRLMFTRDDGEHRAIVLSQRSLASLVVGAQAMLSPQSATPIDQNSLRAGTTIRVNGVQTAPRGDDLALTLLADLPEQDRGVIIPLTLSKKDAKSMALQLRIWLESVR